MTRSLGIDPSTKTGLVVLDGQEVVSKLLTFPGLKGMARIEALHEGFDTFLRAYEPEVAVIEGYVRSFQVILMVEIGIQFRMLLHRHQIPWYICPPSSLKKYSSMDGSSKKAAVASAVASRWGWVSPSDDLVDAYVLAQMGRDLASNGLTQATKGVERG